MTNLENLISAIRGMAATENDARFAGQRRLKVEAPKIDSYIFENRVRTDWHSGVPNHICAYIDTFDENHCAAYVYLWQQEDRFDCTLRLSNKDGAHHESLTPIPRQQDDHHIAENVIASVIAGTQRLKATCTEAERGVPFSELVL